ncbi:DUF2147 domain-containing protein [Saccharicrinis sp. FJH2]|uniref:DUF2147 domain-containing protein n=1 Tax=Saccharicrinis sp. FJH65 TaxID=3344659 RepID=UPI0035F42091
MKHLMLISLLFTATSLFSQNITGHWKTIDDKTGNAKSIVKIYIKDGKAFGDIIKLLDNDEENPLCDKCPGNRHMKPIIGLTIITGLKNDEGYWKGDDGILDPDNGKLYDVKIWREGNKLNVRGYIGPFFRTQTWYLAEEY